MENNATKWPKLGHQIISGHFGGKRWERGHNNQIWTFFIITDHFGGKRWGKVWNNQNWAFQIILDHFGGKDGEKYEMTKIGHSESF